MSAPLIKYLSYFTLCSDVYVMQWLGQLRTCLNLMITRKNSCMSPLKELSIYIPYLLQSLSAISFKQSVKNLGFTLDYHLTMNAHISNISRTCYSELRRLAFICRFLTSTATATLVSAFVLSIYYCSSLLFGSARDVTSYLQRIQNYAAWIILRLPKSSNITTHLKSLHLLPVKVRSVYKIAYLYYHCYCSTAPSYVVDMLQKKPSRTHNTRSSSYNMPLLNRPAHSKAHLVIACFLLFLLLSGTISNDIRCGPSLSFKCRLKTYLFCSVYKDLTFFFDYSIYVHGLAL